MTNLSDGQEATLPRRQAAIAILYQDNQFLLQLRDDKPQILYPGHWAFFGGHLEPGELPEVAIQRELMEEIGYQPPKITHFSSYTSDPRIIRHVFYAPLMVPVATLELNEGMDRGLATPTDVQQGFLYSHRLGEVRSIASPHRQILLEFQQKLHQKNIQI